MITSNGNGNGFHEIITYLLYLLNYSLQLIFFIIKSVKICNIFMYKIVFSIALSSILSACVPQPPAEIKYHHKAAISDNRAKKSSITTHSTKIKTNADLEHKVTN